MSKERQGDQGADLADCGLVRIVDLKGTFEGDVSLSKSVEPKTSLYACRENNEARGYFRGVEAQEHRRSKHTPSSCILSLLPPIAFSFPSTVALSSL